MYVSHKNGNYSTLFELIKSTMPSFLLMFIAIPYLKLLYLMDKVSDPSLPVLAQGHVSYMSHPYDMDI